MVDVASAAPTRTYRLIRSLARGGMGQVDIVVRQEAHFQRVYALKRLHAVYADDPDVRAMFIDEARIAGLIRHGNVVAVLDAGEDEQGPFLVMDYVEGPSLARVLQIVRTDRLPIQVALEIARQAAHGLHAAHELRGPNGLTLDVVHRDVSPQNVLIGFDGVARLTDFGVVRALDRVTQTAPGTLKGKAGYMSPEQLRYEELDRRSDLFSLGVILWEMLAGERLYAGDRPATFRRILTEPAPSVAERRPDTPNVVVGLIDALLAKAADDRPDTARAVAERLESALVAVRQREEPVSLADFMERELATERERHRAFVEEALTSEAIPRELDGEAAPRDTAAEAEVEVDVDVSAVHPRRARAWWHGRALLASGVLLFGGVVALAIALAVSASREATPIGETETPTTPVAAEPPIVSASQGQDAPEAETASPPVEGPVEVAPTPDMPTAEPAAPTLASRRPRGGRSRPTELAGEPSTAPASPPTAPATPRAGARPSGPPRLGQAIPVDYFDQ